MKAAIYLRRSTDENQQASLSVQREESLRFIQNKGWTCVEEHIYSDDAISRAEFKRRPGLLALLNAAGRRAFDVVVTRDETRLGGDMIRTTLAIQDMLDAGVRLFYYFSDEEVRLNDATAKFLVAAKNFAAELEREKIASRTAEHLLLKARKGYVAGGRCFGYSNVEVHDGDVRTRVEYKISAEEAAIVREIFQRYADGDGLKKIAKELNRRGIPSPRSGKRGTGSWSPSVIHAMLRRPRYAGIVEYGKHKKSYKGGTKVRSRRPHAEVLRVEAPHLRIIDEPTWNQVQARVNSTTRDVKTGGRPQRHLLSGIARCSECGGPLSVSNHRLGKHNVKVYLCGYHRTRGETVCANSTRRPVESVNQALVDWIQGNVLTEQLVIELVQRVRDRLDSRVEATSGRVPELGDQAQALRAEIDRLVEALATSGQSPALIQALADREARLAEVDAQLRAQKAAPEAIRLELRRIEGEVHQRIRDLKGALERNPDEARRVIQTLFEGGRVTAKPVVTEQGRRYVLEGTAVIGRLFASERSDGPNSASPTGFEPVLQP